MKPHNFYPNMPPNYPYQPFHHPMPPYRFQPPGAFPPKGMPRPFPGPKPQPKLDSIMDTANKFIATYQSFQPLIAQAAPMIKNLPALWKLYKGFQSIPPQQNNHFEQNSKGNHEQIKVTEKKHHDRHYHYEEPYPQSFEAATRPRTKTGKSVPKIFQPPFDD